MNKMKSSGGIIAIAIAALMSSAAFAADPIVPEPQPAASPLLDNTPIAENIGGWQIFGGVGVNYADFGEFASREIVGDPNAAWLNFREEATEQSTATVNLNIEAQRKFDERLYGAFDGVFVQAGGFYGLSEGSRTVNKFQEENPDFVPDLTQLLISTGTPMEPTTVTEKFRAYGFTLAGGVTFDLDGIDAKVGPSLRHVRFSGADLGSQTFAGVTGAVALTEVNGLNIGANASYERDISGGGFERVWAAGLRMSKQF